MKKGIININGVLHVVALNATLFFGIHAYTPVMAQSFTETTQVKDARKISRDYETQRRARALTVDLLRTVLTSQMRQLEDNGLTNLPRYQDLKAMSRRVESLVDERMPQVMQLLEEARVADVSQRPEKIAAAHQAMRQVLDQLLIERERLRLRRRQAQLVESLNEMIHKQEDTLKLSAALTLENEAAIRFAASSQMEVVSLGEFYIKHLQSVSEWSGELGAKASTLYELMSRQSVMENMINARQEMLSARFDQSMDYQDKTLATLKAARQSLLRLSIGDASSQEARRDLDQAVRDQQARLDKLRQWRDSGRDLTLAEKNQLMAEQKATRDLIENALPRLREEPKRIEALDKADRAMIEARRALFNNDLNEAIKAEQAAMAALQQAMKPEARNERRISNPDSTELTRRADTLRGIEAKLNDALNDQRDLDKAVERGINPRKLTQNQDFKAIRQALNDLNTQKEVLPESLNRKLQEATRELSQLGKQSSKSSKADLQKQVERLKNKLEEAKAIARENAHENEVDAIATEMGEMNRAAEVMNRASAMARRDARESQQALEDFAQMTEQSRERIDTPEQTGSDISDEQSEAELQEAEKALALEAARLERRMKKYDQLVKALDSGITEEAEPAKRHLDRAAQEIDEARDAIKSSKNKTQPLADQADALKKADAALNRLADNLDEASDDLRQHVAQQGEELSEKIEAERDRLVPTREALMPVLTDPESPDIADMKQLLEDIRDEQPDISDALKRAIDTREALDNKKEELADLQTQIEKNAEKMTEAQRLEAEAQKGALESDVQELAEEDQQNLQRARLAAEMRDNELQREAELARKLAEQAEEQREQWRKLTQAAKEYGDLKKELRDLRELENQLAKAEEKAKEQGFNDKEIVDPFSDDEPGEASDRKTANAEKTAGEQSDQPNDGEPNEASDQKTANAEKTAGEQSDQPSDDEPGEASDQKTANAEKTAGEQSDQPNDDEPGEASDQKTANAEKTPGEQSEANQKAMAEARAKAEQTQAALDEQAERVREDAKAFAESLEQAGADAEEVSGQDQLNNESLKTAIRVTNELERDTHEAQIKAQADNKALEKTDLNTAENTKSATPNNPQAQSQDSQDQQAQGQSSQGQDSQDQQAQGQSSQGQDSQDQQAQGQSSQGQDSQDQQAQGQSSQGQDSQGQQAQGQSSQGQNSQGQQARGQSSQGQDSQGQQAQGQSSQGQDSQDQQAQGQSSQGQDSQGQQAQGQSSQGQDSQGQQAQGQSSGQTGQLASEPSLMTTTMTPEQSEQTAGLVAMGASQGEVSESLQSEYQPGTTWPGQSQPADSSTAPGQSMPGDTQSANAKTPPGQSTPSNSSEASSSSSSSSSSASTSGSSTPGGFSNSDKGQDESQTGRNDDVALENQENNENAWTTELPPAVRSAIKNKERGQMPRGYEDQLGAYFRNINANESSTNDE